MNKITIITVCRNAEKTIRETIESVCRQSYKNIEYIIIDGKSTDRTLNIIMQYADIDFVRILSEKDKGIYDAMNKGILMATGDYIFFLNAGDYFCNRKTVKDVANYMNKNSADLYYGNVISKYSSHYDFMRFDEGSLIAMQVGKMPSHQSIFAAHKLFKDNLFDLSYSLRADYKWLLEIKKKNYQFKWMKCYICYYSTVGCSSRTTSRDKMKQETLHALHEVYPILSRIIFPIRSLYLANRERAFEKEKKRMK